MDNLFSNIPADLPSELVDVLCRSSSVRVERIVSRGQRSPAGFWYDQDEHEWVAVLQGSAGLELDGGKVITLEAGDCYLLPAGLRHRVAWTADGEPTVWLAVFYRDE